MQNSNPKKKRNRVYTLEDRKKLSERAKGNSHRLGKHHSDETRKKISEALKGRPGRSHTEESKYKIGAANAIKLKGKKLTEEHRSKLSAALIGNTRSLGRKLTEAHKAKCSAALKGHKGCTHSEETKRKISELKTGANNHNWRGGVASGPSRHRFNKSEWKRFCDIVRERDNYTCQFCGLANPKRLSVHHKIPWRLTHDNSLENLACLCMGCHSKIDAIFRSCVEPYLVDIQIHNAAGGSDVTSEII